MQSLGALKGKFATMKKTIQEQIPRVKAMIKAYIPKMQESIIKGVNPGFKKYKRALQLALVVGAVKLAALAVVAFIMWWMSCKPACQVVNVPDLKKVVNDMACDPFLSDGGWVNSKSVIKSRAEFYADVIFDQFNFEAVPKEVKAAQVKARKPPKPTKAGAKQPPPPAKNAVKKKPLISYLDLFTPLNTWGPFLGAVSDLTSEILKNASDPNAASLNSIPTSQDVSVSLRRSTKYGKSQPVYQASSYLNITLEYNKPRQLQRTTKKPASSGRRKMMAEQARALLKTANDQAVDSTPAPAPTAHAPAKAKKSPHEVKESLMTILQFVKVLKAVKDQQAGELTGKLQQQAPLQQPLESAQGHVDDPKLNLQGAKNIDDLATARPHSQGQERSEHFNDRSLLQLPSPWSSGSTPIVVSALFFAKEQGQWPTDKQCLFVGFFDMLDGTPPQQGYVFANFTSDPTFPSELGFELTSSVVINPVSPPLVHVKGTFRNGYFANTLPDLQNYWASNNAAVYSFLADFTDDPSNTTGRNALLPSQISFPWLSGAGFPNGTAGLGMMPPGAMDPNMDPNMLGGMDPLGMDPLGMDPMGMGPDPFAMMFADPAFAEALKDPMLAALLSDPSMASAMGDFSGMGGNMTKLFGAVSEYGIDFSKVDFSDLGIKEELPGLGAGGTIDFATLQNDPAAADTLLTSLVSVLDAKYPAPNAPPDFPPAPGGVGAPYGYGESIKYDSSYFDVQQFDFPYSATGDDGQPIGCDKTLFNMVMGTNWMNMDQKRLLNATKHFGFGKKTPGERMLHNLQVRYTLSWRTCAAILRTAALAANTTMTQEDYRLFSYTTAFFEQVDAIGLDPPEFCQYISQKDANIVHKSEENAVSDMDSARFWLPGTPYGRNNTNNDTKLYRNQTSYWCITLGSGLFTDVNRLLNPNSKKKPSIDLRDLKLFDTAFRAFAVMTNDTNPDAVMVTMGLAIRAVAAALMRTAQDLKAELSTSLADVSLQCCKIRCQAIFSVVGMALGYLAWIELVVGSICLVIYITIATHVPKFKDPKVQYSDVFSVVVSRVMGQVAGDILEKTGAGEKLEAIKGEAMGAAQEAFGDEIDKAKGAVAGARAQAENLKGQAEAMKAEAESKSMEMQAQAGGSKEAWASHPSSVNDGGFQVVSVAKGSNSVKSPASISTK